MMKPIFLIYLLLLSSSVLISCEDDNVAPDEKGAITIEFDSRAGDDDLELNTEYVNSSGETFTVTKFNYYISNIVLTTADGTEYIVPQEESYFLIREDDDTSHEVTLENIPAGDYDHISFIVGVDSLRNTMDVSERTGVLDLGFSEVMYWSWNSGYIFLKLEGTSPSAPEESEHRFEYHIGGYGGYSSASPTLNNIKEVTLDMGGHKAQIREGKRPQVHLLVDVLSFFSTPNTISIEDHPAEHFSPFSQTIAGNFFGMFKVDHVHN